MLGRETMRDDKQDTSANDLHDWEGKEILRPRVERDFLDWKVRQKSKIVKARLDRDVKEVHDWSYFLVRLLVYILSFAVLALILWLFFRVF